MNAVLNHLRYKIANAQVQQWPYAHFYIEDVWPDRYYKELRASLPSEGLYESGSANYNGRKFCDPSRDGTLSYLESADFLNSIIEAFGPQFAKRFPARSFTPKIDLRLVLDGQNYAIGPHTDAKWKVVSLLFYLPEDYALERLGTSIYVTKEPHFKCPGGPHHPFDKFERVWTAPFRPNSCFGFFKTDTSFHGVEPIKMPCRRDVLLWNLYDQELTPK